MVLARELTPMEGPAAGKVTASSIGLEGSDSAYASMGNTPESTKIDHSPDFADGVAIPSRRFERKVTKLRHFDKEIPQFTQHRFHDLHELFERPICELLLKANVECNAISIKLSVLGKSEATAKPWIVVLCTKAAFKKVKQFFNQPHIKSEYQPPNPDSSLPSFEIYVQARPPRLMAGTEVYGDCDERATMCGRIIKVGDAHQSRFATLGGVMKIVKPPGIVKLYGMTAGHILAPQTLGKSSSDQVSVCNEEDEEEDEGFYSGEEEFELDDCFEGDEEVQGFATTGDRTRIVAQGTPLESSWPKIGCISTASMEETGMGHNLDWALIDFDKPADCRPNLLVLLNNEQGAASNRPLEETRKFPEDGSSRSVLLLSGTGGVKRGRLSTSLSFLMMRPAKAFTKTYTLILRYGSGKQPHRTRLEHHLTLLVLNAGDCGSWVVDLSTCEVYGHIVASDAMGDIYVIPLDATLQDMSKRLQAAVSLPTEADIHTWLAQHAKAAAEQVTVPAKGEEKEVALSDPTMDIVESPRDLQKLAGHPLSQASAALVPSAIKTSIPTVYYCNSCNASFEGTSQDLSSNMLRHLRLCPGSSKDVSIKTERSISQDAKGSLDERSNWPLVKYSQDVQMNSLNNTSTQETSPNPLSWSFRTKPTSGSQLEGGNKVKGTSNTRNNRIAKFASWKIPYLKSNLKWKSESMENSAPPLVSKGIVTVMRSPRGRPRKSLQLTKRATNLRSPIIPILFELNFSAFQEPICVTYLVQNCLLPPPWVVVNASGVAKDSVNALALALYGKVHHHPKIIQQGTDCYGKALRKLAQDLNDQKAMWSSSVLLSCDLLARYEMITSMGSKNWIQHAGGVERLHELRGSRRYRSLEERHIFEAARPIIVIKAITNYKRTFLDQEAWLTLPWAQDLDQKSSMNHLIDIFCIIPGLLEDSKSLHFSTSFVWDFTSLISQDPRSIDLRQRTQQCYIKLKEWKENWDKTYPSAVQPVNMSFFPPSDLKFPIEIFEYAINFPNLLRANEYQIYNTLLFFLYSIMLSVPLSPLDAQTTSPSVSDLLGQRWDAASNLCRAVPYELMCEKHGCVGAYLLYFPLLTALKHFGPNSPEGNWIKQMLTEFRKKWGLEGGENSWLLE